MSTEIKVPELPESVADAMIASWYKQVGDVINTDEVLVDLETDKVILEVPAVKQGVVKEILFSVGDTVTAGQLLAVVEESADTTVISAESSGGSVPSEKNSSKAAVAMSPSVRKLIAENSIDETQLTGTGKSGRILKQDVENFLAENAAAENRTAERQAAPIKQKFLSGRRSKSAGVRRAAGTSRADDKTACTHSRAFAPVTTAGGHTDDV